MEVSEVSDVTFLLLGSSSLGCLSSCPQSLAVSKRCSPPPHTPGIAWIAPLTPDQQHRSGLFSAALSDTCWLGTGTLLSHYNTSQWRESPILSRHGDLPTTEPSLVSKGLPMSAVTYLPVAAIHRRTEFLSAMLPTAQKPPYNNITQCHTSQQRLLHVTQQHKPYISPVTRWRSLRRVTAGRLHSSQVTPLHPP